MRALVWLPGDSMARCAGKGSVGMILAIAANLLFAPAAGLTSPFGRGSAGTASSTAPPFLWGAATSSYQVEGGIDCNPAGGPCDDYQFFNDNPTIQDTVLGNTKGAGAPITLRPAGIADNEWDPTTYQHDFDRARALGLNALRISLEWGRIEPAAPQVQPDASQIHTYDEAAIGHYIDMLRAMRARGLEPVITLNHFTLPLWALHPPHDQNCVNGLGNVLGNTVVSGGLGLVTIFAKACFPSLVSPDYFSSFQGWATAQTMTAYRDFVAHVVSEFNAAGLGIRYWLTVNEPVGSMIGVGYLAGVWSPGFLLDGSPVLCVLAHTTCSQLAKGVLHDLIQAHVDAYNVIHDCSINPDPSNGGIGGCTTARVGFAHAMGKTVAAPAGFGGSGGANDQARQNFDYLINDYFVNAVTSGQEDTGYLGGGNAPYDPAVSGPPSCSATCVQHPEWANHLDLLGINYYRDFHVFQSAGMTIAGVGWFGGDNHNNLYGEPTPHELLNDSGWAMNPQGLHDLIMRTKTRWAVPVLITENGIPERQDRNRAPFIVAHARAVQQAIDDGATVLGYLHWSLLDNWELQDNYAPHSSFGLFHIDPASRFDASGTLNGSANLHRTVTEGALAYQQVIVESRALDPTGRPSLAAIDNAQSAFGALSADGSQVIPPSRTSFRTFSGTSGAGPVGLILGYAHANSQIEGLTSYPNLDQLRDVTLTADASGPVLHESWFDDAVGASTQRDLHLTYSGGSFSGVGSDGFSVAPVPGTGLWKWTAGDSPWGTDYFSLTNVEGTYAGKWLSYSNPGPPDQPTPVCGIGGCVPQVAGNQWRSFSGVIYTPGSQTVELNGTGTDDFSFPQALTVTENLFDVTVGLAGTSFGSTTATSQEVNSGSFAVSKAFDVAGAAFHLTGYWAPAGDNTWIGQRDGSTTSKFQFLDKRALFEEFPVNPDEGKGPGDQYFKENEPFLVTPLNNFFFSACVQGCGALQFPQYTVSWQAGGRSYSIPLTNGFDLIKSPFPGCLSPGVCNGSWHDTADLHASRLSEQFPPVVGPLADQTIEASAPGGANVTLTAPNTFDLDGQALSESWSVDGSGAGSGSPTVFLSLKADGSAMAHTVCVTVDNGNGHAARCATYTVSDTIPPVITCGTPDGIWHATDVSIPCTASDIGAGLSNPAEASFMLVTSVPNGTETANAPTGTRAVCDRGGNCATAGPISGNLVDKKPPTITIVQPAAATYPHSTTLTLNYTVTDGGSGVDHFVATMDGATTVAGHGLLSGQAINLLTEMTLGPHTFTVDAIDKVGNANTVAIPFTIVVTPQSIKDDVTEFFNLGLITKSGIENSLLAKLGAAANARSRGQCATAANIYQAFIHEVTAQSGKAIDPAAATVLIDDAQYLIDHCP